MNSFPSSVCIWAGIPNLQNHSLKMVSATVPAFLFWTSVTTAYFVKASVMQSTNFLLLSAVNICLNKSAWILQLGCSGIGSGDKGIGLAGVLSLLTGQAGLYIFSRPGRFWASSRKTWFWCRFWEWHCGLQKYCCGLCKGLLFDILLAAKVPFGDYCSQWAGPRECPPYRETSSWLILDAGWYLWQTDDLAISFLVHKLEYFVHILLLVGVCPGRVEMGRMPLWWDCCQMIL